MKIMLNESESEEYFYNALCNGLKELCHYNGLLIYYDALEYSRAKEKLLRNEDVVCFEDVLMEILRSGGKLTILDEEGGYYTRSMIEERDDAITADVILQSVFFKDIIFG